MTAPAARVRELLQSRDPDACAQAVELAAALGDTALYGELLRGCRLVEGTLMGNALFPGGDWQTRMSATSLRCLLSLIATAPAAAPLHPSLRRGAIHTLRIGVRAGLDIPHDVEALTALRTLNLRGNGLTELPDSIAHFSVVERLELSQNKLPALPAPVARLSALRHLDLSFNPLDAGLSEAIGQPQALEELVLRGSRIRVRPADVARLPALRRLQVNRGLYRDARHAREELCAARPGLVVNL